MDANNIIQEIESVMVVNQLGVGSHHEVGTDGITSIVVSCRQISSDSLINVILVKRGEDVVDEISMSRPYILGYKHQ
mgnify:CR=1 FL=1